MLLPQVFLWLSLPIWLHPQAQLQLPADPLAFKIAHLRHQYCHQYRHHQCHSPDQNGLSQQGQHKSRPYPAQPERPDSALPVSESSSSLSLCPSCPPDPNYYYAKVMPIIQSSGFGKTKLCVHLSLHQPGLLVCMRSASTSHPNSFPPQDKPVFDYFEACRKAYCDPDCSKTSEQGLNIIHANAAFFLAAYCDELYRILSSLVTLSGCFLSSSSSSSSISPTKPRSPVQIEQELRDHDPVRCWNTIVYSLALLLHRKQDFVSTLHAGDTAHLCRHSQLHHYGLLATTTSNDNSK